MKKIFLTLLALVITVGFTACSGQNPADLNGDWKLVSYGSKSDLTPAAPGVDTTLTFGSDGKVSGNVGCNSFSGDYKVSGNRITFGAIASTLMGCSDPIAQQEGSVFSAFTNKAAFTVDGSTLTITSADGNSVAVFAKK